MKTKHLTGNTVFNDSMNLPEGMLSIDEERKAIRFYDGQTVGGYEILGQRAVPPSQTGPGPQVLIGGDEVAGFYGAVPNNQFISYSEISTLVGMSAGVLNTPAEGSPWFKFVLDGKILYYPQYSVRYGISWLQIKNSGALDGSMVVTIDNDDYSVRLMRSSVSNPSSATTSVNGGDPPATHGSEWNRLMYPICVDIPPSQETENWASYTNVELGVYNGNGYRAHAMELVTGDPTYSTFRGYYSGRVIDGFGNRVNTTSTDAYGWRPVLERL